MDKLPPRITDICAFCFGECPNVVVEDFSQIKTMGVEGNGIYCLSGCGTGKGMINIVLPDNLDGFTKNCFYNYAKEKIQTVTYSGGGEVSPTVLSRLGLTLSNPQTIESLF
jgi:hypothetical protein